MGTTSPPLPPSSWRACAAEGGCPRPRPIPTYRASGGTSTSRWKLQRREQARGPSNAVQSLQMTTPFTFEIRGRMSPTQSFQKQQKQRSRGLNVYNAIGNKECPLCIMVLASMTIVSRIRTYGKLLIWRVREFENIG